MSIDVFPATVLNSTLWNGQTYEEGTFTVTATGFSGTAPSGIARYIRVGKQVTLWLPVLSGTSNAITFTFTGVPTALWPYSFFYYVLSATEGGTNLLAFLYADSAGNFQLLKFAAGSFDWVASGTKALRPATVSYVLP